MNKPQFKTIQTILIWSENDKTLADWYGSVFELEASVRYEHPQDTGTVFKIGEVILWIGKHSEVHGSNPDPYRHMFNIEVDSVTNAATFLKGKKVICVAEPFKSPVGEKYFATFKDPEENIFQIVGPQ